jgi:hypothetical protein
MELLVFIKKYLKHTHALLALLFLGWIIDVRRQNICMIILGVGMSNICGTSLV